MKNVIASLVLSVLCATANAQVVDLVSLGSGSFSVQFNLGNGTQDGAGLIWTPSVASGVDTTGGTFTSANWSSYLADGFGVRMSIIGTNQNLAFSVTLYDSSFNEIDTWSASTVGINATPGIAQFLSVSIPGTGDYSSVSGAQFSWGGTGSINTKMTEIVAVPEPSTYALLALSALGFGGYVVRRRRRA